MKDRISGRRRWCAPIERKEPWAAFLGVLILLMFFGSVTSGQDAPPKDVTEKKAANENGGQGEQEGLGSDESSESKESKESSAKTVITATRIETPIEQAGSSITVIESQEIKDNNHLARIGARDQPFFADSRIADRRRHFPGAAPNFRLKARVKVD